MDGQGRVFSNVQGASGMLGLDIPLHNRHSTAAGAGNGTAAHQMVVFPGEPHPQTQLSIRQSYPQAPPHHSCASDGDDDDEPGGSANDGGGNDAKRKASQWHRMKWTDTMVKLLIMAVYYIGDEAGGAATTTTSSDGPDGRKNSKASAAAGLQQKKGKWKSVSRAMMEKGYCVSPQQCEDKFNDLNKRYKRVNDILGRGTACRVVENQSLLEAMDLSPKLKEEARKLLNSKHLFFREMCAYHNSCASAHHHSPEPAVERQNSHPNHGPPAQIGHEFEDNHGDGDDEEEEEEEYSEEEDWEAEEVGETGEARKRARVQEMKGEVMGVMGDPSKTASEKRAWVVGRLVELEEAGVGYQAEALEMEKQRWKWARYCRKKEFEMERKKLQNEQMRLENQRMLLLLRHKELQFF